MCNIIYLIRGGRRSPAKPVSEGLSLRNREFIAKRGEKQGLSSATGIFMLQISLRFQWHSTMIERVSCSVRNRRGFTHYQACSGALSGMTASRNRWLRSKFESRRSRRTCWQTIDRSFCWRATQASICHERRKACIAGLEPDRGLSPDEQHQAGTAKRANAFEETGRRNRRFHSPVWLRQSAAHRCRWRPNRRAWPAARGQVDWPRLGADDNAATSRRSTKTRVASGRQ